MPLRTSRRKENEFAIPPSPYQSTSPTTGAGIRDDVTAALFEYIGTTLFLLLAFGGTQAAASEAAISRTTFSVPELVIYVSLSFGFSLLVTAWLFFRVTGGLFNPAISLALFLTGSIGLLRFVLYCVAQLVGGITAAAIILALTPGPLLVNTFPGPGVNKAQAVFIEMFITSALVLAVLMLALEKHRATPVAPIGIGLTYFVCHLWAVRFTGAGMNTARSFGPAAVTGFPHNTHWIYWLGPLLGSLLGWAIYKLLHLMEFWVLNPGQDCVDHVSSKRARESVAAARSGTPLAYDARLYPAIRMVPPMRVVDTESGSL